MALTSNVDKLTEWRNVKSFFVNFECLQSAIMQYGNRIRPHPIVDIMVGSPIRRKIFVYNCVAAMFIVAVWCYWNGGVYSGVYCVVCCVVLVVSSVWPVCVNTLSNVQERAMYVQVVSRKVLPTSWFRPDSVFSCCISICTVL
jgi:hypothetical protein